MRTRLLAAPVVLALVLSACGGSDNKNNNSNEPTGTVNLLSAMEPGEAKALNKIFDDLVNSKVKYKAVVESNANAEAQAKIRIDGGNPPEIVMYPQPGTVIEWAKKGKAIALEDLGFTKADLEAKFGSYLVSLGEYNGKHYGLPTNVNLKSMVWYPKKAFEAKNYTVPKTWDELIALSDKIVADNSKPWCVGFESGGATGWPATDWMEDIMLRTAGTETYDKWVKHEIPFNDPSVKHAAELFGKILFTPNYVLGGAKNSTGVKFGNAPGPMFNNPPGCWLHRQATFINAFFPKGKVAGVDYDWFPFPPIDKQGILEAGELSTVFKDTPAVRDFLKRFISQEVQCAQGKEVALARVSPNGDVGADCYSNTILANASTVLAAANKDGTGRFDASDLMPSSVGSGSFWTGMIKYIQDGPSSLDKVLADIEKSWPKA
jgi:alpha-glucoside transport system substrate-binding protein